MKENNSRRREQREQREKEMREMNTINVVEVQAMIHPEPTRREPQAMIQPEPTRREPQNEIIIEDMEIVGEEQTESKEKEKEKNKEQEKKRESRICSFWIKGKCKFGKDCRSAHPVICKTIMEKGICQEKCDKFHPRMCDEMKRRGVCFRGPKCYYAHFGNINTHN